MEILRVIGIGLTAVVLLGVLRTRRPEMALLLSLVTAVLLLLSVLPALTTVVRLLEGTALTGGIRLAYMTTILKIIGIAYLAEFAAQVSRDAGEGAVGAKIELAGKVLILVLAVPIVGAVLQLVLKLVP